MVANGFSPGDVLAVIPIPPGIDVCEFIRKISAENDGIQIEQRELERLTLMAPAGSKTSARNLHVLVQLGKWTEKDGRGIAYDSNTLFILPDGRKIGPDAAWMSRERLGDLATSEGFLQRTPEFVIELQSPSDGKRQLRDKMKLWIDSGSQLGWLIDPKAKTVEIYRGGAEPETLTGVGEVAGDGPVAGFTPELARIWDPMA